MRTTLTWFDPHRLADVGRVDVAGVVPFAPDGRIVAARLVRGVEFPAGHVEDYDSGPEQTARREAWEETGIRLGSLAVVQLLRADHDHRTRRTIWAVFYTGLVQEMPTFTPRHESFDRVLVHGWEYVARYGSGPASERFRLLANARVALPDGAEADRVRGLVRLSRPALTTG
ncbi:NUDIX hydrolase [Streptomyces canus]|uniref:NUDIX hydrolase n=1 Tax=Streptomyces canus TaxID=58343 RepID=UPI00277EFC0E|nr:NUDIX domain-containing protein [Streptomyces canus]MDQ0765494.1 8-oxo-dGTP pyrophosphatase MutT (NUDIX family) [Streptomyces canus]